MRDYQERFSVNLWYSWAWICWLLPSAWSFDRHTPIKHVFLVPCLPRASATWFIATWFIAAPHRQFIPNAAPPHFVYRGTILPKCHTSHRMEWIWRTCCLAFTLTRYTSTRFLRGTVHENIGIRVTCGQGGRSRSENRWCSRLDKHETSNLWEGMQVIHSPVEIVQCHTEHLLWTSTLSLCIYFELSLMLIIRCVT